MAKMFPPVLEQEKVFGRSGDFISSAEIDVFHSLEEMLGDDWDIFHSVWFRDTAGGEHAEGDFVLIGPDSVLLLEIKGGKVDRDASGKWEFRTQANRLVNTTTRGPVDQARSAWYALKNHVKKHTGSKILRDIVWGYGVITPDCLLNTAGADPGFSKALWLDQIGYPEKLPEFLSDLSDYWREDQRSRFRSGTVAGNSIKPRDRDSLVRLIRPVVGHVEGAGVVARAAGKHFYRLTRDQYKALDYSRLESRVVIEGGAGTGKTLLAMERARREAGGGKRVLFTCFNRLLADQVNRIIHQDPLVSDVTVANYHQLVRGILDKAGLSSSLPEEWDAFNEVAPDLVLEALANHDDLLDPWDYLIVDEAQDLLNHHFFSVLDMLLKKGLEKGRWLLCFDTEQALFSNQYDREYAEEFVQAHAHRLPLEENCRNTRQISAYGHAIGHVQQNSVPRVSGPDPDIGYVRDPAELKRVLKKTLNRIVSDFRNADLGEERITILLAQKGEYEDLIRKLEQEVICRFQWLEPGKIPDEGMIQISTVQAFKGLESDAVILVGLESLEKDWQRRLFYVAATRARSILKVFFPDSADIYVQRAMPEIIKLSNI